MYTINLDQNCIIMQCNTYNLTTDDSAVQKTMQDVQFTLRMPADLLAKVEAEAETRGISKAKVMVAVMQHYFGELSPIDVPPSGVLARK